MNNSLTNEQILQKVAAGEMTAEEAGKLLKNKEKTKLFYKVSPKGAVSFYGMRRMPITLYITELEQMLNLVCGKIEYSDDFQAFVDKAGDSLSRKTPKDE